MVPTTGTTPVVGWTRLLHTVSCIQRHAQARLRHWRPVITLSFSTCYKYVCPPPPPPQSKRRIPCRHPAPAPYTHTMYASYRIASHLCSDRGAVPHPSAQSESEKPESESSLSLDDDLPTCLLRATIALTSACTGTVHNATAHHALTVTNRMVALSGLALSQSVSQAGWVGWGGTHSPGQYSLPPARPALPPAAQLYRPPF